MSIRIRPFGILGTHSMSRTMFLAGSARHFHQFRPVLHSHSHGGLGHSHSHSEPRKVKKEAAKPLTSEEIYSDLDDHDHVHLKESETETNDSFTFGKITSSKSRLHEQNELLVWDKEKFWKNPGVRITWIGLAINVGMAAGKLVGGIVFHSQALMADSVHAISDLVSDFLTLCTVGLASKGPTENFPYGFGKVETVGSLAVSSILAMAGLSIGWASLTSIIGPMIPLSVIEVLNTYHLHLFSGSGHSHGHIHAEDITNINAAWIAAASVVAKEWIFRATSKIAKEQNSKVLLANAWHHRVDSLTSLVAFTTITSGYFLNIGMLDSIGGLIVSGLVIKAGFNGVVIAVNELVDRAIPKTDNRYIEVESTLDDLLSKLLSNNNSKKKYSTDSLILLTSGPNMTAKIVLEVPLQRWDNVLDINEFEIVSHHIKKSLMKEIPNLRTVQIEFVGEKPEEIEEGEGEEAKDEEKSEESKNAQTHDHNAPGHTHHH